MPGPPPPPPPGGPPPPMMAPSFSVLGSNKGSSDNRGALLQSIRTGTKLKKTVTIDKSGPIIPGKVANVSNNQNTMQNSKSSSNNAPASVPNGLGLGGLFAGGMPKLRPTGRLGATSNNTSDSNNKFSNSSSSLHNRAPETPQSQKVVHSIQSELKKQMASDSKNRGPPPPAPVRLTSTVEDSKNTNHTTKNGSNNTLHHNLSLPQMNFTALHGNNSFMHRKVNSNVNLNNVGVDSIDATPNNNTPIRPVINHGKPNLAPKPPALNGKPVAPPKKLLMNGKPVSRTQSMRSPRTPSPQSPDKNNANYPAKFGTVRNLSSVLNNSLGQSMGNLTQKPRPPLNGRPSAPPPSIPQQFAPPPPSKMVKPVHAPPPPPQHAPPPPPFRTAPSQPSRAPPAVPPNAPPPPPRHSSIREVNPKRISIDLEAKFANMFHNMHEFPKPITYRNVTKIYNSKQVVNKQQAPLPPNHVQLLNNKLWDSSTC